LTEVDVPVIRTERLELVSFSAEAMRAAAAGESKRAEELLGATIVGGVDDQLREFFEIRLADLAADPGLQPWLGRAVVLGSDPEGRRVIGSVGFHGRPDATGRAEIGYQIEPASRGRGFASEAVRALLDWAAREHDVRSFRGSIAPDNAASLALAARLGFVVVGRRMDDVDGEELVLERDDWVVGARA
jgi:[ribosomal protein S5]-alanine N-acetyltransferase